MGLRENSGWIKNFIVRSRGFGLSAHDLNISQVRRSLLRDFQAVFIRSKGDNSIVQGSSLFALPAIKTRKKMPEFRGRCKQRPPRKAEDNSLSTSQVGSCLLTIEKSRYD
jgi:hypothetical protein